MSNVTDLPTDVDPEEHRAQQIEQGMVAAGEPTHELAQADYFGVDETFRCVLPDGVSYVEHKLLAEGDRRRYLNKTNSEVRVRRATNEAAIKTQPGDDRYELFKLAVVDWNLVSNGRPVPFNAQNLDKWLAKANPRIVDLVEKDIRKHNPWLLAEMSSDDIRKEIAALEEMLEVKLKEEEGNVGSSSR